MPLILEFFLHISNSSVLDAIYKPHKRVSKNTHCLSNPGGSNGLCYALISKESHRWTGFSTCGKRSLNAWAFGTSLEEVMLEKKEKKEKGSMLQFVPESLDGQPCVLGDKVGAGRAG